MEETYDSFLWEDTHIKKMWKVQADLNDGDNKHPYIFTTAPKFLAQNKAEVETIAGWKLKRAILTSSGAVWF